MVRIGPPRRPANALAAWHINLPSHEQKRLNTDLLTKAGEFSRRPSPDLRRNFREGLLDIENLRQPTINFLKSRYGITFSNQGSLMEAIPMDTSYRYLVVA